MLGRDCDTLLICYSARGTSAAPTYFKAYTHSRTRRTYIDGAVQRNNTIRVADEERCLIWRSGNRKPDIILSIGSGIQVDRSGGPKCWNKTCDRWLFF